MFKLESYITPILLNYVAKYVKNIREEDARVSLWEGEATFHNLDMRLDVLENELNLPVDLVSGHIHELCIQVPWTKLMSEPVRIVINTIEFVAKLPDAKSKEQRIQFAREQRKQKQAEAAEEQQSSSTGSGVVSKIINNITLECNNIILKYVEDDIVVSMNVQCLNFSTADCNWKAAMVDVSPTIVLMRKVLQISDLTICLDKRNTAGLIEVCQEPVLYRCTLECRVLRKYNVSTVSTSSTTRIGVFTKSLDFNVSSLQFPMVMRLIKMLLELKPADPDVEATSSEETIVAISEEQPQSSAASPSIFQWAWNLLPSFEASQLEPAANELPGHAFDIGIYAEELNFQLKNSDYFTDQTMGGIKRIRYTPILRIALGGIFYERSLHKESDWTNVKAGLASMCMEPLGTYRSEEATNRHFIDTQEISNNSSFIDKSLFDEHYMFAENLWCTTNSEAYFARNTDDYMLFRSPVLAFDIVEYRASQAKKDNAAAELVQRIQYRLLSAGITFHYSQSLLQVKNYIYDLLTHYNYTGYYAEKLSEYSSDESEPDFQNSRLVKDFDFVLGCVPLCNYRIVLRDMTLKFYPRQQNIEVMRPNQRRKFTVFREDVLPHLQLKLPLAEGTFCSPVNPERLVSLIVQQVDKPRELIESCYSSYRFDIQNLMLMAVNTTPESDTCKFLSIPRMNLLYQKLLLPHMWRVNEAALEIATGESEIINLDFSKREFMLVKRMIPLILKENCLKLSALSKLIAQANAVSDVIKLQTLITKFSLKYRKYTTHSSILSSLGSVHSDVYHTVMNMRNVVLTTAKGMKKKCLEFQLQLPADRQVDAPAIDISLPTAAIGLWIEPVHITADIYLLQFFEFCEKIEKTALVKENELDALSDSISDKMFADHSAPLITIQAESSRRLVRNVRKISVPEETIHLSSDRDEKAQSEPTCLWLEDEDSSTFDIIHLMTQLQNMVVQIDIGQSKIDINEVMNRKVFNEAHAEYTSIRLPKMKVKSGNCDLFARANIQSPILLKETARVTNWNIALYNLRVVYHNKTEALDMLEPVRTDITLALSYEMPERKSILIADSLPDDVPNDDPSIGELPMVEQKKKVDWLADKEGSIKAAEQEHYKTLGIFSINVHVDMSDIHFTGRKMILLYEHCQIILNVVKSLFCSKTEVVENAAERSIEVYTGSAENCLPLKKFLGLDTQSESSSENDDEPVQKATLVVFGQWTIPRIVLELESHVDHRQRKIVLMFEELLLNVDKQASYCKFTTKVVNAALNYHEITITPQQWEQHEGLELKTLGDNSADKLPLLNVVVTIASLKDLYTKIGAHNLNKKQTSISEVWIILQPIEVVFDLDKANDFAIPLCETLEIIRNTLASRAERKKKVNVMTSRDMPLIHLNCQGIYLYMPLNSLKLNSTVLLMRINRIIMTPDVQNKLVRQAIRQDVYQKAAELNMLDIRGSLVENRQYELRVHNVSLSSGCWLQTQKYRQEAKSSRHSNPAVEWNNQSIRTELQHKHIFKEFGFITTYAPAIAYEQFLICGQHVEFNCGSNVVASVNTHQIILISCIAIRLKHMRNYSEVFCFQSLNQASSSEDSIQLGALRYSIANADKRRSSALQRTSFFDCRSSSDTVLATSQSDSGNYSANDEALLLKKQDQQLHETRYPHTVSFVTGNFVLKIYDLTKLEDLPDPLVQPLIMLTVSHPSFMLTHGLQNTVTHASIFDIKVNLASREPTSSNNLADTPEEFTHLLFDTQPGVLGSTGLRPPLLTIRSQRDRTDHLEMDIELHKPIVLRLSDNNIKQLMSNVMRIYSVMQEYPCFPVRMQRRVVHTTPMLHLKLQCFNADRLYLAHNSLIIKFYNESRTYKCTAICMDFNARIQFNKLPQKAAIKSTLGVFYLQANDKILLHPLLIRLTADLLSEPWCDQLLVTATLKMNMLHVDASILSILQLRHIHDTVKSIMQHVSVEWDDFLQSRPMLGKPSHTPLSSLIMHTPTTADITHARTPAVPKEEFYQDDLRAGAFQFVNLNTDAVLPMPYQVQIIKKNYGIICWRYPQPRKMHSIEIYPVPMPVNNPLHIKCRMEYFSQVYETFLHYCDFELSQSVSKQIELPTRSICANIWRVVIMQSLISVNGSCFETDEDDELQSIDSSHIKQDFKCDADNDFILHPKVLVGCMRVDTIFQPELVPKMQLLISCKDIELNFLNQPDAYNTMPPRLKKYKLKRTTDISQTFATVHMADFHLCTVLYSGKEFTVETDFCSRVKCLDYGFLNMIDIVEPITFHSFVHSDNKKHAVTANFLLDKLRINVGPCIIHTLLASKHHWQEMLQVQRSEQTVHTLMPKCVVINRIMENLTFGQTRTSERIQLEPNELNLYYFRSDYYSQELTFYIKNPKTEDMESSESMHIVLKLDDEQPLVRHLRIGQRCLTIKVGKLSATQVYILVKGQIEVVNMSPYELLIDFRNEDKIYDTHSPVSYVLSAKERSTVYHKVVQDAQIFMRLKFKSEHGRGRSGDVPLKINNKLPWLVKVPTNLPQQYVSVWVRILREDILLNNFDEGFEPQKILISIWPIFEVCNLLSCSLKGIETSTEETFSLPAMSDRMALSTATTHNSEHKVIFNFDGQLNDNSESIYTLSIGNIEWYRFFHYDPDDWTIEKTAFKLSRRIEPKWPLDDPEELSVQRNTASAHPFDISYRTQATREFSCTLGLDIVPWIIFINASGIDVSVHQLKTHERYLVEANGLEMLPVLQGAFTVDAPYGSNWIPSLPVCLDESAQYVGKQRAVLLRSSTYQDIVLLRNEEVLKFVLEYYFEDDRHVLKLRSKFVVSNFADISLQVLPLTMDHKESSNREELVALDPVIKNFNYISVKPTQNSIGYCIDSFYDLNARKAKHTTDTAFVFFVCFSIDDTISIPIPLTIPFTRRCFSVQNGKESIPLVVTLVEKKSIYYLSVLRDTAPYMIITNNTNIMFIVAQTSASGNSTVSSTTSEFAGKHFDWNQMVLPHSKCYYTPPQMYANFPDVQFTLCNLSLALYNQNTMEKKQKIGWSKPIRTDKTWIKFLHVPNHGDVKVVVCDKHRIKRLTIHYISQQLEFSVKDLRSRLKKPEPLLTEDPMLTAEPQKLETEHTDNVCADNVYAANQQEADCRHFQNDCDTKRQLKISVFVKKFVFSLQTDNRERDYLKTEVCNFYADDIMLIYMNDSDQHELRLQIPNLQVDNQLFTDGKYDFPVLVCSEQLYRRSGCLPQICDLDKTYEQQLEQKPIALFTFQFYEDELQLNSISCTFNPFRVYIEDAYLNQLLETLMECEPSNCLHLPNIERTRIVLQNGQTLLPEEVIAQVWYIADPLRLDCFNVEPITLLLSVHTSSRLYIALDHSPLSFSRYQRQQILTLPLRFGQSLGMHYLSGAIFGAGWVVGSLEILGSPSGLARSFSTGVRDFVSMPVEGLLRGPWGFVVGITQGSASLVRNVTAGTVNSVTKLAGSVARNLDRLTLDAEHIELTDARRRLRPQGFADGFAQGLTGFGISLLGAVGGLAHHTLEARSSVDVLTGLTKGIVGALTKPISGAAEMLALTGQGMLHTVGFNTMPQQVQPSVTRNVALHRCSYYIWRFLPEQLSQDQVLFFHEINLLVQERLRPALIFLTSTVLAIMEADKDNLTFVSTVAKVEVVSDRDDTTKLYLNLKPEQPDDEDRQMSYTNERIMKFLNDSLSNLLTTDSLIDLLGLHDELDERRTQCVFYIKQNIGEHLMHYLKVLNQIHESN